VETANVNGFSSTNHSSRWQNQSERRKPLTHAFLDAATLIDGGTLVRRVSQYSRMCMH
jgi:hypothetical protein